MSLIMTKQEREAFLADVHVGIISISEDRSPCRSGMPMIREEICES
jgi:hypothetical protein